MIIGAHVMLTSKDRDADIAFFRDILKLPNVDAGEGYMLFGVPSSEVAVHAEGDGAESKLYMMCDDVGAFIKEMEARGIPVTPVKEEGWGSLTEVTLPGGNALSVYQPHHPRPATGGKGGGGKGKGGKGKKAGKVGKKAGRADKRAATLSPERQARREERKKKRAAGGASSAASSTDRKARKEQRKAKRAEKKAKRGGTGDSSTGTASTAITSTKTSE